MGPELYSIILVLEFGLLGVVWCRGDVAIVVWRSFFLLARGEHALDCQTDSNDAEDGRPLGSKNGGTDMAVEYTWG